MSRAAKSGRTDDYRPLASAAEAYEETEVTLEEAVLTENVGVNIDTLTPSELLRLISDALGEIATGEAEERNV